MYKIGRRDRVIELEDAPPYDIGSPYAQIFASDSQVVLFAFLSDPASPTEEATGIMFFERPRAHYFGMPNDEALGGHPLFKRGLGFYGLFEVLDSSWVRHLERVNSVHDRHDPKWFENDRHFIFTLKESTFECVAEGYHWVTKTGTPTQVLKEWLADQHLIY